MCALKSPTLLLLLLFWPLFGCKQKTERSSEKKAVVEVRPDKQHVEKSVSDLAETAVSNSVGERMSLARQLIDSYDRDLAEQEKDIKDLVEGLTNDTQREAVFDELRRHAFRSNDPDFFKFLLDVFARDETERSILKGRLADGIVSDFAFEENLDFTKDYSELAEYFKGSEGGAKVARSAAAREFLQDGFSGIEGVSLKYSIEGEDVVHTAFLRQDVFENVSPETAEQFLRHYDGDDSSKLLSVVQQVAKRAYYKKTNEEIFDMVAEFDDRAKPTAVANIAFQAMSQGDLQRAYDLGSRFRNDPRLLRILISQVEGRWMGDVDGELSLSDFQKLKK